MLNPESQPRPTLSRVRLDMIDSAGRLGQFFGLPRSTGQIYGLLYLSPRPLPLDEIAELLGISKASASTGTRQLSAYRAIRQIWVQGDRRDHFEVEGDLVQLIQASYAEFFKPRLAASGKRLEKMSRVLEEDRAQGVVDAEEYKLCAERLQRFMAVQQKLQAFAPVAEKLF